MAKRKPNVAFIVPYPVGHAPSQRFRVEMLLPILDETGVTYSLLPFMDEATWKVMYKGGHAIQKVLGILKGYFRRLGQLPRAASADWVFIHREAAPLGPPVFEWILAKVLRKKLIYDFDDAVWIPLDSGKHRWANWLKCHWKVPRIIRWSHTAVGGNDYLCDFARKHNGSVVKIPTVVDTEKRYDQVKEHTAKTPVVVGWTGSHSTLLYLQDFSRIIAELQEEISFIFLVIADQAPALPISNLQFIPWNTATEISDLLRMDVGVMPLHEDRWAEGKCGFKLIQYLALGIPALATPMGVNRVIIDEGTNGYLCRTVDEWKTHLRELIGDAEKRARFGNAGREQVVTHFSISSQRDRFRSLFTPSGAAK